MYDKPCECQMTQTIETIQRDVTVLQSKIDGDGNGNKGLVRKCDSFDLKLNAIIGLLMIVLGTIVAKWAELKTATPPAPTPHVSKAPPDTSAAHRPVDSPDRSN